MTSSGIRVLRLHYSADPSKDPDTPEGLEWIQRQLRGYPSGMKGPKWQREMEINFAIRNTRKVWPDFIEMMEKVTCEPFDIEPHWPLWGGYDYGYTNPFAFVVVAFKNAEECYMIDEIYERGQSVWEQARLIKERPWYPHLQGIVGDSAIFRRDQQDGPKMTSIAELFYEHNIFMDKGEKYPGIDAAFINLLNGVLWQGAAPRFKIFRHCTNILREFRMCAWKQWASDKIAAQKADYEEIVNKNVDAFDALKYVMLSRWRGQLPEALAAPKYSFEWELNQLLDRTKKYLIR